MNSYEKLFREYKSLKIEYEKLKKENAILHEEISRYKIKKHSLQSYNHIAVTNTTENYQTVTLQSTSQEKIQLYRKLFRGREDVFALRWESAKNNKSGYSPVCANEWKKNICTKPKVKCSQCNNKAYTSLTDKDIYEHLSNETSKTIGIYPLLADDTCKFLAIDFDKSNWQEDSKAFIETCKEIGIAPALEKSRSGNGAHIWIFFSELINARLARKLGDYLLSLTLEKRHEIGLDSYDRLFPNQDTLPTGGLGNLIALPLQGTSRKQGNSVFLDEKFQPYKDQWGFLSTIKGLAKIEVEKIICNLEGRISNSYNVCKREIADDKKDNELLTIWEKDFLDCVLPHNIEVEQSNLLYIKKEGLPSKLINKLMGAAIFNNPEFYRAQALRLATNKIPRIINCSEDHSKYLALPRGCIDRVRRILEINDVNISIIDKRNIGISIDADFIGVLTDEQLLAAESLFSHEQGILSAATGFGKTVIASWLIGKRKVNTLVIVHRTQLMDQWKEKLGAFLNIDSQEIGVVGGGKNKRTGIIDIAVMQSLVGKNGIKEFIKEYGQVIVDECHHVSAFSFEQVMKEVCAKYVHGLTATPTRKDGHQPIIKMQCGDLLFNISTKKMLNLTGLIPMVTAKFTNLQDFVKVEGKQYTIQEYYNLIATDEDRNQMIFNDVLKEIEQGRTPLILTERTTHVEYFQEKFKGFAKNIIIMRGGMRKKQKQALEETLATIKDNEEMLIIATGKFIGEGFDNQRLDCLFLVMPIAWKGTLQQYVGRLHRSHLNKKIIKVYDYVDSSIPALQKMYEKRVKGYRNMGYEIIEEK